MTGASKPGLTELLFSRDAAGPDEPAANGTYTVVELANRLQQDPVVVQQLLGNGQRDEVDAALTKLAESADYPVYVALVNQIPDLREDDADSELASLLHARIGKDGLYVVSADPSGGHVGWQTYGAGVPAKWDLSGVNEPPDNSEYAPSQSAAGDVAELVATAANDAKPLHDNQLEDYRTGDLWVQAASGPAREVDPPTAGTYAVVTTSIALGLTVTAFVVLRAIARWRELAPVGDPPRRVTSKAKSKPPSTPRRPGGSLTADGPAVRAAIDRELDDLAPAIARAHRKGAALPVEAMQTVEGSRAAAEAVLAGLPAVIAPQSPALLDAVGALVLVRSAREVVDDPQAAPYRPCFLNPCHGRGDHVLAAPAGTDEVEVPVCRLCKRDADRPERFDPLVVRGTWGRARPYYEGDSVWARTGYGAFTDELWRDVDDSRGHR
ncbi:hypothetical protein GCM10023350_18630 [Nocardioides endophyticus]|uniref:Uncharacterized protein n=1 Tax=Nocardioides endophyticus TaxID=1353775 RepID=A0ABP8YQT3_9ACTN